MDASFNGFKSEAGREGGNAKADAKKGGGSTNGMQNHPIIFKSKSFQWAFYMLANLLCFRGDYNCTQYDVTAHFYRVVSSS